MVGNEQSLLVYKIEKGSESLVATIVYRVARAGNEGSVEQPWS